MFQRTFGGVRYLNGAGPSLKNVALLDHNSRPMVQLMARTGMLVDLTHFSNMEVTLKQDLDQITEEVKRLTGHHINMASGEQKSRLLFHDMGLKQARPVMTASGDRESVENEVLVAIQHLSPVVGLMLQYAELDKLLGTYVRPIQKLAVRSKFGEWRLYPKFKTTRTPSGRYACVAKGTLIEIVRDSKKYPKGIPIEDVKVGDLAYTFDKNLNLTLRRVKAVFKQGKKKIVRVHWRGTGGKTTGYIDVTADHKIRLTTGEYTEAQNLKRGQSVCFLSRGVGPNGYCRLWATGVGEISFEHRFVWGELNPKTPMPDHVHHINKNKQDNRETNLQGVDKFDHISYHSTNKIVTEDYRRSMSAAQKLRWSNMTEQERNKFRKSRGHERNLTKEWIESELIKYQGHPVAMCKANKLDYATFQKYAKSKGVDWKLIAKQFKLQSNHIIVAVMDYGGEEETFDIEIEDTHNFIAGELCVHNCAEPNLLAMPNRTDRGREIRNGFIPRPGWVFLSCDLSQIEVRIAAHRSKDKNLMNVYLNNEDIYYDFATTAFKKKDERYQDETGKWIYPTIDRLAERFPAKTCVLASIYRVTESGLLAQMPVVCKHCGWISLALSDKKYTKHDCPKGFESQWHEGNCLDLINSFYIKYGGLIAMQKMDDRRMLKYAYVWDDWGRLFHTTAVRSVHPWVVQTALREGGNQPVQGTAGGCLKLGMAHAYDDYISGHMSDVMEYHLMIHDELLPSCREDVAEEIGELIKHRFENCVKLDVPIKAEYSTGPTWGTAK